jgi:tetratricopeptide (TPR) repeat protein
MSRAAFAVLAAVVAARAAAAPGRHVDPEAIGETRRAAGERFASARAIGHYLEARRAARAGDVGKALEQLRLAVTYDPESPELRVSLAEALAEAGKLEAAEAEARRAAERATPASATASDAQLLLARLALARRARDAAVSALASAIRIEKGLAAAGERPDPAPWRLLAGVHADAGDEEGAARVLEELAGVVPGDGGGFRELGRSYLDRHEPGRAERHLRRAVALDARDAEALRLLAHAHEALRRDAEAREDLVAVLRLDPDDEGALLALGRMAVRQADLPAAREWFHRYVRAAPDGAAAHVRVVFQWLEYRHGREALEAARAGMADGGPDPRLRFAEGLALEELRRWPEAAEALARIRADDGEVFVSSRVALAEALSRSGRHAEAERALDAPLAAQPRDARLITMRAAVLDRAGRPADSVALLKKAVAERERAGSDADLSDLKIALADSLARANRTEESLAVLRAAVAARPRDEELLFALGAAYDRAGQAEVAVAQMRALLAVNPDHPEALNFVGYTYAEQGVRLDEAERLVRRALELKPRSGHILDSLGWVLFRRGEARQAVELLEQADALAGPDATILEHLGDAYRATARLGDATQAYRRALASVGEELPSDRGKRRASLERKLRELGERARR